MVLDKNNAFKLNSKDISFHDDIIEKIEFFREEKRLHLTVERYISQEKVSLDFLDVIGFEMTSCDFWAPSPRISSFFFVAPDEQTIIPKLFQKRCDEEADSLKTPQDYIESEIEFISGDSLRVACERITI